MDDRQQRPGDTPSGRGPATGPGVTRRVLRFPLIWMVGGVLLVFVVPAILVSVVFVDILLLAQEVSAALGAVVSVVLYCWVMRGWAGRQLTEFPRGRAVRDLSRGLLLGFVLIGGLIAILVAAGGFSMRWIGLSGAVIWSVLLANLWPGVVEELVFRGLVLQALERVGGSWLGLVGSVVLFGAVHGANPGASVWTTVAISLEAGLLLGAAFLLVRNLWLPIGIHYAWDVTQNLAGVPQGGETVSQGLWRTTAEGPGWLTGMPSSIEASVVAVALGVSAGAILLVMAIRRGSLRRLRAPGK